MAVKNPPRTSSDGSYDPYRLSSPRIALLSMLIFLIIVAFLAAILFRQISTAFVTNPGLNGLIFGVLIVGILLGFQQVIRLVREVHWVNSFREGHDEKARKPVLLAPMRALVGRRHTMALSTSATRAILDSIANRLDESRDISRYLISLLVFLGLLGTFWGLLQTIGSIGDTIQSLNPTGGDATSMLDTLKSGLQTPLRGMGTAFSSSLFGLSGSLILGFLDLQSGRAQNRFYTELENWLASVTDVTSDVRINDPLHSGSPDDIRVLSEKIETINENGGSSQRTIAALSSLADGIQGLVKNMRNEQQMMRDWVEKQAEDQKAIRETLEKLSNAIPKKKEP
ncbi:MAG: MotA/TolQ/ExbB proton channel family protein [Phyllobacterium sp.]